MKRRALAGPRAAAPALLSILLALPALAQPAPPADAAAPESPPPAPGAQRIEITGGRGSETEQRRRSTAAKIVIGRDEIEKFGDSTVGEVLRRLPGVTVPGGGAPRLRGLGGGYTQLLIDGQRVPRGFSLDSLTPDQIERIEILRAPTAETGARAIAGTLNIITRDGFVRRLNDLRLGVGVDDGAWSKSLNWTHNDQAGAFSYNLSGSAFDRRGRSDGWRETERVGLADGRPLLLQREVSVGETARRGVGLNARLQWRLSADGDQLTLSPGVFHSRSDSRSEFQLEQPLPATAPAFERGDSLGDGRLRVGRLNLQWRQRLDDDLRLELNAAASDWRSRSASQRREFDSATALPLRTVADDSDLQQRSASLNAKLTQLLGERDDAPGSGHQLVGGVELEATRRAESQSRLEDGVTPFAGLDPDLQARSARLALYAQDEWALSPQWALHVGARWERIDTRADGGAATRNRSQVFTPLLHAVWKPAPKSRDQLRFSLTRSYRSPALNTLIARPTLSPRFPATGPNDPTSPDRVGNPALRPELASGLDIAAERYLAGGGLLSANLFYRRIADLMRGVTTLEDVPWSPVPRYVSRQQNVGDATTQGLELEAKFALDSVVADAPRVELRGNLALYRSRVAGVPGPDNRLDQQAAASANLGADYRLRGLPLTLGGNLNWVPAYDTRLSADESISSGGKRVVDAFVLWTLNPAAALRLSASNLVPRDSESRSTITTTIDGAGVRETARSLDTSSTQWQLRLELKL